MTRLTRKVETGLLFSVRV